MEWKTDQHLPAAGVPGSQLFTIQRAAGDEARASVQALDRAPASWRPSCYRPHYTVSAAGAVSHLEPPTVGLIDYGSGRWHL